MIPVIDISDSGTEASRRRIGDQIAKAAQDIGFFTIRGHGLCPDLIARMRAISRAFFDLPADIKATARRAHSDHNRGFFPFGEVALAKSTGRTTPPDRKEVFSMGPIVLPPGADLASPDVAVHFAPNYWPAGFPQMQAVWVEYFDALLDVSHRVMRLCALALDLPERHFDAFTDYSPSSLAAVDYFERADDAAADQLRAGEHTDYGVLTLLLSENKPGGLQVRTRAGEWVDVITEPDALVVNIGDLMQQWTNDKWVSNMHRVANPPADAHGSTRRMSIAFFFNANFDARIECIPSCMDNGRGKYGAVLAGEHRLLKYRRANKVLA